LQNEKLGQIRKRAIQKGSTLKASKNMDTSEILFVGLKEHVVALSKHDGREIWKTKLISGFKVAGESFVSVLVAGDRVYAHTRGNLFCLDALNGKQLWTNDLAGLGYDIATLAILGAASPSPAEFGKHKRKSSAEAGGAAAAF
jgi:outer membrane protein assembly factor BamB